MRSAAFGDWRDIRAGRAQWYSVLNFEKQDFSAEPFVLRTDYPAYRWPAAGMFISAEDLARFVDALGAGRVLKPSTLESYWKPVAVKSGEPQSVALGSWTIADDTPGHYVVHEGGARSAVAYGRDDHLTIVVLTNLQGGVPTQWIDRIRALYAPESRK